MYGLYTEPFILGVRDRNENCNKKIIIPKRKRSTTNIMCVHNSNKLCIKIIIVDDEIVQACYLRGKLNGKKRSICKTVKIECEKFTKLR